MQFGVEPADGTDAHRPVVMDLWQVLCVKEQRSVSLDGCVQWDGRTLQLAGVRPGLKQVEVWQQIDGTLLINDGGQRLSFGAWTPPAKVRRVIVNNKVHKPTARQQINLTGSRTPGQSEPARRLIATR